MPRNPNHVTDHNELRTAIVTELGRFGLPDTVGGPWAPGDPNHVGAHNAMVDALASVATAAGKTYTNPLPPHRALGDTGHIGDHDAMRAAVTEAATWPAWNSATGGTVTDIPNYAGTGQTWRVHKFTANDTFTVTQAAQTFRVLVQAGGGGGGSSNNNRHGGGGSGGFGVDQSLTIPAGTHAITVGAGGAAGIWEWEPGQPGGASAIASLLTQNGGPGGPNMSDDWGVSNGATSAIVDGVTSVAYGRGSGPAAQQNGDTPGTGGAGRHNTNNGQQGGRGGLVVIAYRIG